MFQAASTKQESIPDRFRKKHGLEGGGYGREKSAKWETRIPIRVRAMVLAGDKLFAAGFPDSIDSENPWASFKGEKGALLNAYSTKDGSLLSSQKLPASATFDGMIAVNEKLYLVTDDHRLICMGEH